MNDEKGYLLENQIEDLNKKLNAFEHNDKMFKALDETAVGDIGQDFFNNIVIKLAEWLNTECVIIGQLDGDNKVIAVPMYLDDKIIEDYSYDLNGTSCDLSLKKGFCNYSEDIINLFPEDKGLVDLDAEGYVGTALYNKEGQSNGILCALSRKTLQFPPQTEDIMKIIGSRITAEIERRKSQEDLRIPEAQLREANAARDKFFSIIAHDLRSSFNSILGFSELLIKNVKEFDIAESEKHLEVINSSAKNTLVLFDNLLNWSKSQTGQLSFMPKKMMLSKVIQEIIEPNKLIAAAKNIFLNYTTRIEFKHIIFITVFKLKIETHD